jgi:rhodanese-related sulfurtransferase
MQKNMKRIFTLLLAVAMLIAAVGCSQPAQSAATPAPAASEAPAQGAALEAAALKYFSEFPGNRMIEWTDLFTLIDAGEEPFILSIRQADVYGEGHIKGAYLASWGADLAEKVAMLPKDKPVYVYCYSGQTAGQAVALMNMLGIEAYSVKSGYNYGAMKTEGYEAYVETTPNERPDARGIRPRGARICAGVL